MVLKMPRHTTLGAGLETSAGLLVFTTGSVSGKTTFLSAGALDSVATGCGVEVIVGVLSGLVVTAAPVVGFPRCLVTVSERTFRLLVVLEPSLKTFLLRRRILPAGWELRRPIKKFITVAYFKPFFLKPPLKIGCFQCSAWVIIFVRTENSFVLLFFPKKYL